MPTETVLKPGSVEPLFGALPALLQCAFAPEPAQERARRFARMLASVEQSPFSDVLLFYSRGNQFVYVGNIAESGARPHDWLRWPLDRLFAMRRACIITSPSAATRALAIPFASAKHERCVAIAPVPDLELSAAQQLFVNVLESLAINVPSTEIAAGHGGLEPAAYDQAEDAPSMLLLGTAHSPLASVARERGFTLECVPTLGHVLQRLRAARTDIVVVEERYVRDALSALRMIRHGVHPADVAVLYIGETAGAELQILADAAISSNAAPEAALRVLKRLASEAPARRALSLAAQLHECELHLSSCANYHDFCRLVADTALTAGAELAAVSLVGSDGALYQAEQPSRGKPLVTAIPACFLSGDATISASAGEQFFSEAFDDAYTAQTLAQYGAKSGVSIPISSSGRVAGTFFGLSFDRSLSRNEIAALLALTEIAGRALGNVRAEPVLQPWHHCEAGTVAIHSYTGPQAAMLRHVHVQETGNIYVVFGSEELAARLDAAFAVQTAERAVDEVARSWSAANRGAFLIAVQDGSAVEYGSAGFPAALEIRTCGPAGIVQPGKAFARGRVDLRHNSLTLFPNARFFSRAGSAAIVDSVQYHLQRGSANATASLPDLGDAESAFVAFTMRSEDTAPPPR